MVLIPMKLFIPGRERRGGSKTPYKGTTREKEYGDYNYSLQTPTNWCEDQNHHIKPSRSR